MRDVFFVAPSSYNLQSIERSIPPNWRVVASDSERLFVEKIGSADGIEILSDDSILGYYDEPKELDAIQRLGAGAKSFVIHFKQVDDLKELLGAIADRDDLMIDNDFDGPMIGSEFVAKFKVNPLWDWARS